MSSFGYSVLGFGGYPNRVSISNFGGRGVFAGEAVIDYVAIATNGNATDFGDLQAGRADIGSCASTTQLFMAVIASVAKEIQVITIATTGNSTDWADITGFNSTKNGTSSAHGGVAA